MKVEFSAVAGEREGLLAGILRESYKSLLESEPFWKSEEASWEEYDRSVFQYPETVGACIFLTRLDGRIAGFASWDPRQAPAYGIVGHNCVLPEYRGRGLGRLQIDEVVRRLTAIGIRLVKVTANDHPSFIPAQRMYAACAFQEVRRFLWERNPSIKLIEYEMEI